MNTAKKGRRNEHRTIELLESAGYRCMRSAASKGCWDVFGVNNQGFVLVQVKTNVWPNPAEMEAMRDFPSPPNTTKLIHRWNDRLRYPIVKEVE